MKNTLYFFAASISAVILFTASTHYSDAAKAGGECCQKFVIISPNGVLTGCTVTIQGTSLSCIPDPTTLECEICGFTAGNSYTAEVNCDGGRRGSTTFNACVDSYYIYIFVQ